MGRYWIRNRGRVQGPFTVDRLQGLMRRGRFNRHFHVSEDKKEWIPAGDIPELFEGMRPAHGKGGDDEETFHGGGSPFDDDFAPGPVHQPTAERTSPFKGSDDEDSEDGEDDWEDDESSGVVDWVEANSLGLVLILVLVLGGLGWFLFSREDFTQDQADLDQLIALKSRINSARVVDQNPAAWMSLSQEAKTDLAPVIKRLEQTASRRDRVKQELLYAARDDIPRIFEGESLEAGEFDRLITQRFARIKQMIQAGVRVDIGSNIGANSSAPAAQRTDPAEKANGADGANESPNAVSGQPESPSSNNRTPKDNSPDAESPGIDPPMEPASTAPGLPGTNRQNNSGGSRTPPPRGGIPGRRPKTK